MSKFEVWRDEATKETRFSGSVSDLDLQSLDLDRLDRMVIESPASGPADYLQSLEIIFRRLAQKGAEKVNDEEVAFTP